MWDIFGAKFFSSHMVALKGWESQNLPQKTTFLHFEEAISQWVKFELCKNSHPLRLSQIWRKTVTTLVNWHTLLASTTSTPHKYIHKDLEVDQAGLITPKSTYNTHFSRESTAGTFCFDVLDPKRSISTRRRCVVEDIYNHFNFYFTVL